jgi:hypothetical protein
MGNTSKERWKLFHFIVDNENLNLKEKCILLIIFRYRNWETGYANPSRRRIKELAGIVDNRTLDNVLNSIIAKGYLLKEKGIGTNSRYYIREV